jgi:hypothetical protein
MSLQTISIIFSTSSFVIPHILRKPHLQDAFGLTGELGNGDDGLVSGHENGCRGLRQRRLPAAKEPFGAERRGRAGLTYPCTLFLGYSSDWSIAGKER